MNNAASIHVHLDHLANWEPSVHNIALKQRLLQEPRTRLRVLEHLAPSAASDEEVFASEEIPEPVARLLFAEDHSAPAFQLGLRWHARQFAEILRREGQLDGFDLSREELRRLMEYSMREGLSRAERAPQTPAATELSGRQCLRAWVETRSVRVASRLRLIFARSVTLPDIADLKARAALVERYAVDILEHAS